MYKVKSTESSIQNFIQKIIKSHYFINEEYQRSKVWKDKHKQKFIKDLLEGHFIGVIVLKRINNQKYEIIDGQQRYSTIKDFIKGELKITGSHPPFIYKDLKKEEIIDNSTGRKYSLKEYKKTLSEQKIYFIIINKANDIEIAQLFLSINEGVPLNSAEKLNAQRGWFRELVFKLTKNPLFDREKENNIGIQGYRFHYREICAQLLKLEYDSLNNNEKLSHSNFKIRETDLRKIYDEYKKNRSSDKDGKKLLKAKKRVEKILNLINNLNIETKNLINEVSFFRALYCVLSDLDRENIINKKDINELNQKIFNFLISLKLINSKDKEDFPKKLWPKGTHKLFFKNKRLTKEEESTRIKQLRKNI